MIANWVKESSATVGTGIIGLGGAVSGFVPFAAVFLNGQYVDYYIEDGASREHGIGLLNFGSPNTLARSTVLETLAGGAYTRNGATAISLSGSATISVSPSASTALPNTWGAAQAAGTGLTGINFTGGAISVGAQQTANRLHLVQYVINKPLVLDKLSINVATAEAAVIAKPGIWQYVSDRIAGRVVAEPAAGVTLDCSTTGVKTLTLASPVVLQPGTYWVGAVGNSGGTYRPSAWQSAAGSLTSGGVNTAHGACNSIYTSIGTGWQTGLIGDNPISIVNPSVAYSCPVVWLNYV